MAYKRGWTRPKLIFYLRQLRKRRAKGDPVPPKPGYNPMDANPVLFYDPSDISKLFQDADGTVPVTAAGQQVMLMKGQGDGMPDISFPLGVSYAGGAYLRFTGAMGGTSLANIPISGQQMTLAVILKETTSGMWRCAVEYGDTWNTAGSICINGPADSTVDTYAGQIRGTSNLRTRFRTGFPPTQANPILYTADWAAGEQLLYVNSTVGNGYYTGAANPGLRPAGTNLPLKVGFKSAYDRANFIGYIGPILLMDRIPVGDELDDLLGWGMNYVEGFGSP